MAAVVLIGPMGKGVGLVQSFYKGCPREAIGPGLIAVGAVQKYSTLEGLVDLMLIRDETQVVIVNHGNPTMGLIMPFMVGSPHTATGLLIDTFAALGKLGTEVLVNVFVALENPSKIRLDSLSQSVQDAGVKIRDAASKMGVSVMAAVRLVRKLVQLQNRQRIIFLRGCNIGANPTMLAAYKVAFGAIAVQAPNCRMFYLRIKPHHPSKKAHQTMASLKGGKPTTEKTRRRTFEDGSALLGPLVVDVRDIDGHVKVDTESFSDDPAQTARWGNKIMGQWQRVLGDSQFVMQVVWDDSDTTYNTLLEIPGRRRLVFAP